MSKGTIPLNDNEANQDFNPYQSAWYDQLVNAHQTSEERRSKYWLLRSIGVSPGQARYKRDWRLSKLERVYKEKLAQVLD